MKSLFWKGPILSADELANSKNNIRLRRVDSKEVYIFFPLENIYIIAHNSNGSANEIEDRLPSNKKTHLADFTICVFRVYLRNHLSYKKKSIYLFAFCTDRIFDSQPLMHNKIFLKYSDISLQFKLSRLFCHLLQSDWSIIRYTMSQFSNIRTSKTHCASINFI